MRVILMTAAFWAALTVGVFAQSRDIETTIGGQIDAFLADDFETAFTFASPSIQGMFGTPENFGRMVRDGYPMVWRPAEVQYLELRDIGGALWQRILIRDADGAAHLLDYQMIETETGWKINGVQYIAPPDVNA